MRYGNKSPHSYRRIGVCVCVCVPLHMLLILGPSHSLCAKISNTHTEWQRETSVVIATPHLTPATIPPPLPPICPSPPVTQQLSPSNILFPSSSLSLAVANCWRKSWLWEPSEWRNETEDGWRRGKRKREGGGRNMGLMWKGKRTKLQWEDEEKGNGGVWEGEIKGRNKLKKINWKKDHKANEEEGDKGKEGGQEKKRVKKCEKQ